MLQGARLLQFVGFPASEILGPSASEEEIKSLIDRHGEIFIKPVFKGGVGKKGKAGLLGRARGCADFSHPLPIHQMPMAFRCSRNASFSALIISRSSCHSPPLSALCDTFALPSGLVGPVD